MSLIRIISRSITSAASGDRFPVGEMTKKGRVASAAGLHLLTLLVGMPALVATQCASAQSRFVTEGISYYDNSTSWVLGQTASATCLSAVPASASCDGNDVMSSSTFDPTSGLPLTTYSFGKLQQTFTYNANGTVATVKDGNNNVTNLTDWYRGIPRTIQYADGAVDSAAVSPPGWVTSVTNAVGSKTCYAYDAMGRVSQVTYPSESTVGVCDASAWNIQTFTFTPVAHDEHGLAPGHWTMRNRLGNRHVNTYYDALWRPVLEESLDYADIGGTLSQVVKRYDHEGRVIFQSYPKRGVNRLTESQGVHTVYDVLGRVTGSSQDSEHGLLTTLTEYLTGFQARVTNPRGFQTLTQYQTFDQPTYDFPNGITQFAGSDTSATEIHRDVFGKPSRIRKRNADGSLFVDRQYIYAWDHSLCKSIEPEVGATVFYNDAAGNLWWSAAGLNLPSTSDCNFAEAQSSGRKVTRSYDARNRLHQLLFPDGRGDQLWTYTPDGLPLQLTAWNDVGGGAPVVSDYVYNKRRLLTGESIHLPNWYVWGLGYGYDANGSLASQTYPTGLAITYAPNALGQATQARDQSGYYYASGASYHPNGAIKQFTYGNGLTHTMTQNARQLPARVISGGGALDYDYGYDANGNVGHIYDYIPDLTPGSTPKHRWMSYDGLDRLTSVGSVIFGGDHWHRFTYDALDNMKSWKLAGVKDYAEYVYDARNQLGNIKNSSGATIVGFGYDLQGNLANKNGSPYTFDYGNRLREAYGPTGAAGGPEWYRYDAHGRRVHAWGPSLNLIASQYSQSGQILYTEDYRAGKNFEYIYLAGSVIADRVWTHATQSNTTQFKHTDALGSPVAVTNQAGTVIERNDYEPYGAVIGKPNYQGIGYTGHVQDGATGLTYMQQRYYDPQVGLFLSVDPVTAYSNPVGMFNRYRYAANNPYRFTDPDGRTFKDFLGGFADGLASNFLATPSLTQYEKIDAAPQPYGGIAANRGNSDYSAGRAVSDVVTIAAELVVGGSAVKGVVGGTKSAAPVITKPYARPSGTPTAAQRASVQGKPCVDCGALTPRQVADHKTPLVQEYYTTGGIDMERAKSLGSVQSQCPTCSARQGAEMSRYSKEMKREHGLDKK